MLLTRILAKFLFDGDVDLVKQALVSTLLCVPKLFLVVGLIALLKNDIAVKLKVEDHLLNHIIGLKKTIFVGELGQIVRRLGIVGVEGLDDLLFFLLCSQLLLVEAAHLVVLLHVQKISVVFQIITGLVYVDLSLLVFAKKLDFLQPRG